MHLRPRLLSGALIGVIASIVFIALWELATVTTTAFGPTLSELSGHRASVAVYVALVIGITLGVVLGRLLPSPTRRVAPDA